MEKEMKPRKPKPIPNKYWRDYYYYKGLECGRREIITKLSQLILSVLDDGKQSARKERK
jgi:hypothetical protein